MAVPEKMKARELLSKQRRFDLTFKMLFLRHSDSEYFRALYLEHMRTFNNFYERCPVKTSPADFVEDFLALDRSMEEYGYDDDSIIYTDAGLQIMNGAHRLACAAMRDLAVPVVVEESASFWAPDYGHFLRSGLDRGAADHNALEYVKANPNAWILQLHASADLKHEAEVHAILAKYGFLYYAKNARLSENGYVNLTLLNYGDDGRRGKWVGTKADDFAGARKKARRSMGPNPLRIVVFACDDAAKVVRAKNEIREMFGLGNDSCHINDRHAQGVAVAEAVFNANSLFVLNRRDPLADLGALDKRLDALKKVMNAERTACGGSSPLNAAGLRVAADLDCLSLDAIPGHLKKFGIADHSEVLPMYPAGKREMIENPSLHFWHRGVKFASLKIILAMKEKRGEVPKDVDDCALIRGFLAAAGLGSEVPRGVDDCAFIHGFLPAARFSSPERNRGWRKKLLKRLRRSMTVKQQGLPGMLLFSNSVKNIARRLKARQSAGEWFPAYCSCSSVRLEIKAGSNANPTPEEQALYESEVYKTIPGERTSSKDALCKLLTEFQFESVLDLGAGNGVHSGVFLSHGKKVSAIIADEPQWFAEGLKKKVDFVFNDYLKHEFPEKFDCIWASHILEHIRNIGLFLDKVWDDLNDGGILALTVPATEMESGDGHINIFTPGHLVAQLLEAGFDMRDMRLKTYGYNLSVICRKNAGLRPDRANFARNRLITRGEAMPQYLIDGIEGFKRGHPSSWGGHERIPLNLSYRW